GESSVVTEAMPGAVTYRISVTAFDVVSAEPTHSPRTERSYERGRNTHDKKTRSGHPDRAGAAADHGRRYRAPALRNDRPISDRARRLGVRGERRQPQSVAGRHDDGERPLQEASLAGQRSDVLPAPSPVRQAFRRAERAGRRDRRAHSVARRREHRDGSRRRRDDADPAPS